MLTKSIHIFLLASIFSILAGCAPFISGLPVDSPMDGWKFSDIKSLDGIDNIGPDYDIIAVYSRQVENKFQIRLDLLEIARDPNLDIHISLNVPPTSAKIQGISQTPEKMFISIPQGQPSSIKDSEGNTILGISVSTYWLVNLGYLVIELQEKGAVHLWAESSFDLFTSPAGSKIVENYIQITENSQTSATNRASLVLEFWDVMPGFTPAQTLRRWDGAHTGPFGSRHGLNYLLEQANVTKIPVVLLDLIKPSSLAALDYLGKMNEIRDLQRKGIIILPDPAFGDPMAMDDSLRFSQNTSLAFGLKKSSLIFAPISSGHLFQKEHKAAFLSTAEPNHFYSSNGLRLIPLPLAIYKPDPSYLDCDRDGLSLEAKKSLINSAISADSYRIVVMGGSLSESAWGDASSGKLAFNYIATHPWIQPLRQEDLLSFPALKVDSLILSCGDLLCSPVPSTVVPTLENGSEVPSKIQLPELRRLIRNELSSLSANSITNLAWMAYFNLTKPSADLQMQQLQANYLGEIGNLIAASKWASNPVAISNCSTDLDWDQIPECILASKTIFTTYEKNGARLMFAFYIQDKQIHQWIGPASEFSLGIGSIQDWQLRKGAASDPNEIPGAFIDMDKPFQDYDPFLSPNSITFTNKTNDRRKTFQLIPNGLVVNYKNNIIMATRIPVTIFPEERLSTHWIECFGKESSSPPENNCPISASIKVSNAAIFKTSYLDSIKWMDSSENPSFGYPSGHYLPFPIELIELEAEGDFSIRFNLDTSN